MHLLGHGDPQKLVSHTKLQRQLSFSDRMDQARDECETEEAEKIMESIIKTES